MTTCTDTGRCAPKCAPARLHATLSGPLNDASPDILHPGENQAFGRCNARKCGSCGFSIVQQVTFSASQVSPGQGTGAEVAGAFTL